MSNTITTYIFLSSFRKPVLFLKPGPPLAIKAHRYYYKYETEIQIGCCILKQKPIRGAAEHIAGIRKAGYVVSINKNKRAAIFRHSDVGIVGDAHILLPLLIARLEKRKG